MYMTVVEGENGDCKDTGTSQNKVENHRHASWNGKVIRN